MTRHPTASPPPEPPPDAAPSPLVGTFELGVSPAGVDLGAHDPAGTLQQALGLGAVVTGPDAPALPLDACEPPPRSRLGETAPPLDPAVLASLHRLAGPDPTRARATLAAALRGEPFDPRLLPDARAMLLGLARVVVAHGVDADDLLDAVAAAMIE